MREVLRAHLLQPCPYGEPPEITPGDEPSEWLINGEPRDLRKPKCLWIAASPSACVGCALNPHNAREKNAPPSARLQYLFYLESLQAAGAMFLLNDLPLDDWRGLITIKRERAILENERLTNS